MNVRKECFMCVCETQRGTEREQRQRASCFGWFPTVISSTQLFVLPTSIRWENVSSGSKQVCTEGKTVQKEVERLVGCQTRSEKSEIKARNQSAHR